MATARRRWERSAAPSRGEARRDTRDRARGWRPCVASSASHGAAGRRGMGDLLQVDHRGVGVQLLEDVIGPPVLRQLRDGPRGIGRVAEGDGARRAGGGTRRRELVRDQVTVLECRAVFGLTNALNAEGALLHYALSAHGDIGIELPVERLGKRILLAVRLTVTEPVEVADLVGAVVRAVARADAAIVDLHVQPIRRVIGGVHRTHGLAGRVAAMLTEHRDEARLELFRELAIVRALEVPLETDPVHLAAAADIEPWPRGSEHGRVLPRCADGGNVVLGITGG